MWHQDATAFVRIDRLTRKKKRKITKQNHKKNDHNTFAV